MHNDLGGIQRLGDEHRWAYYSDDVPPEDAARMPEHGGALYRYALGWDWSSDAELERIIWVLINPSTATHERPDPTAHACVTFSRRWGYGGMIILNPYAYRATKPSVLRRLDERTAIGPANDWMLRMFAGGRRDVVFGWGRHCTPARAARVHELFLDAQRTVGGFTIQCLGCNNDGSPKHPLYVARSTDRRFWPLVA